MWRRIKHDESVSKLGEDIITSDVVCATMASTQSHASTKENHDGRAPMWSGIELLREEDWTAVKMMDHLNTCKACPKILGVTEMHVRENKHTKFLCSFNNAHHETCKLWLSSVTLKHYYGDIFPQIQKKFANLCQS